MNLVLTCLLTAHPDSMRSERYGEVTKWEPDPLMARTLTLSLERHNADYLVFHDEIDIDDPHFVKITPTIPEPYVQRWLTYHSFLLEHPEVEKIWCVDATDVELLQDDPFDIIKPDTLYCGWHPWVVGIDWMREGHEASREWVEANADLMLLNAGVVGGDRDTMLEFTAKIVNLYAEAVKQGLKDERGDVGYQNRAAYTMKHLTGPRITTIFGGWDRENKHAIFCHK